MTGKPCPKCGTTDCEDRPPKFTCTQDGVINVDSKDIFRTCKARQQLKALKRLREMMK